MKNRRGFLLAEETLKIIVAVISIGFLVYFLGALYFSSKTSADLEMAKSSLKHLADEISSGSNQADIYNPKGWVLSSWPTEEKIPNKCSNLAWKNCICLNEDISTISKWISALPYTSNIQEKTISEIDKSGTCLESEYKIKGNFVKIDSVPLTLEISGKEISRK